ncbi:MAG: hypothetical protein HS115_05010 [Spirochaetales bacterium]|nr:hypothetical protein [Spirochaetales bacterium]
MRNLAVAFLSTFLISACTTRYAVQVQSDPSGAEVVIGHRSQERAPFQGEPLARGQTPANLEFETKPDAPDGDLYMSVFLPGYEEHRFLFARKGRSARQNNFNIKLRNASIYLRGGQVLQGAILQTDGSGYVVFTRTGKMFVPAQRVVRVEFH